MNEKWDECDPRVIEDVSNALQIAPAVVEKDVYVTQTLRAISGLENNYFKLIFHGGTALSKAHRLIQRMSEDCDFRIVVKEGTKLLSKEGHRRQLRVFRRLIADTLSQAGFSVRPEQIQARNGGRFMEVYLNYPSHFPESKVLRTEIKLEFMAIGFRLPPEKKSITTLIHELLQGETAENTTDLLCITAVETGADKWVAFTRRVASLVRAYQKSDASLIRHLYDLYMLNKKGVLQDVFYELSREIIEQDRKQYANQNSRYAENPYKEIRFALKEIRRDMSWEANWKQFIEAMVFRQEAPPFNEVLEVLEALSEQILKQ